MTRLGLGGKCSKCMWTLDCSDTGAHLAGRLVPIRLHSTSSHSTVRSCSKPNIFHCKTMVKYIVLTKLPSDSIALHPHHLCRAAAVPIHCKCTMYNLLQHSGYWSVSRPISLQWSALAPTTASNNKSYVLSLNNRDNGTIIVMIIIYDYNHHLWL